MRRSARPLPVHTGRLPQDPGEAAAVIPDADDFELLDQADDLIQRLSQADELLEAGPGGDPASPSIEPKSFPAAALSLMNVRDPSTSSCGSRG
ncbi:hypothetical protein LJK87_42295 [Paenibacillus sp. P25]|nr:hypothetical protein LJK87_42295 [Paenibacillus sp. P25]